MTVVITTHRANINNILWFTSYCLSYLITTLPLILVHVEIAKQY